MSEGKKGKEPWWVRENLPVPPAWGEDHPDHPASLSKETEKKALQGGAPFARSRPSGPVFGQ
jgi:hypothetical protein